MKRVRCYPPHRRSRMSAAEILGWFIAIMIVFCWVCATH